MIFISVNTPTKKGNRAGEASDLRYVEAKTSSSTCRGHTIVVEKSTLPVKIEEVIKNFEDLTKR